jgi:hypothetical protein
MRNNLEILELISDRFARLGMELSAKTAWDPNPSQLDFFQTPKPEADEDDVISDFQRQMKSPPMSQKERDDALDQGTRRDEDLRQDISRPILGNIEHKWNLALVIYSNILKSLDLIKDTDKRKHLSKIVYGWSVFTMRGLQLVPELIKEQKLKKDGITYSVKVPRQLSEAKAARVISIALTYGVARAVLGHLGTEKLERQLMEPSLDESRESRIAQFYRTSLIVDLRLGDWMGVLRQLSGTLKKSPFLFETLVCKITAIYLLGDYKPDIERRLRALAAEVVGDFKGGSHADRKRRQSELETTLQRRALVQQLQVQAEERREIAGDVSVPT